MAWIVYCFLGGWFWSCDIDCCLVSFILIISVSFFHSLSFSLFSHLSILSLYLSLSLRSVSLSPIYLPLSQSPYFSLSASLSLFTLSHLSLFVAIPPSLSFYLSYIVLVMIVPCDWIIKPYTKETKAAIIMSLWGDLEFWWPKISEPNSHHFATCFSMMKTDVGLANAVDLQQRTAALVVITIWGRLHQHMYFQSSARRICFAAIWR